jgi:hypothetical protein
MTVKDNVKKAPAHSLKRICNLVPSKGTEKDWKFGDALASGALGAVAAPPPSVDFREAWWKVGDQGMTGSCVGWATADGVARYHMVKANKLAKTELLSPRFIWMASKELDEYTLRPESFVEGAGTSLKTAMDVLRKYGVVTNNLLSFDIKTHMYVGDENTFYATAAQRRTNAYFNLYKDKKRWKSWLAAHGPLLVGLTVDRTWDNAAATKGMLDKFVASSVRGGHAVAVVGYTKNGRFIIRNSWGKAWGDKGFAYASEAYIDGAFYDEAYGVSV